MLLREVTATGDAPGSLAFAHDTMFRHTSERVGGDAVTSPCDADGLLTRAGSVFLTREGPTGRLSTLSVAGANEAFMYTAFGELATYQARSGAGTVLDLALSYDAVGRLTEKRENAVTYTYGLRRARSLAQVLRNGLDAYASQSAATAQWRTAFYPVQ